MFLDPVEGFLTMQQASQALQERLAGLLERARATGDEPDAAYYEERMRYVADLATGADPDDIFEQDSFRRLFIAELQEHTSTAGDQQ